MMGAEQKKKQIKQIWVMTNHDASENQFQKQFPLWSCSHTVVASIYQKQCKKYMIFLSKKIYFAKQ